MEWPFLFLAHDVTNNAKSFLVFNQRTYAQLVATNAVSYIEARKSTELKKQEKNWKLPGAFENRFI